MKIVQAFGQEPREAARFSDAVEATMAAAHRRILLRALMTAIVIGLIFGSITLVLWEGAIDVQAGRISGGSIAAFVLTGGIVAGAFGALTEVYGDLLRGAGAAGRLSELLRERPEIAPPAAPRPRCPTRAAARWRSRASSSATRPGPKSPRSTISRCGSNRVRPSRSSAHRARARPRCFSCSSASTTPPPAGSPSTASTCATPTPPRSAPGSRWCRRRP